MGNHIMEHCPQVNTTSPIVLEVTIIETQKQPTGVVVTQSLDVGITTTRGETIVVSTMDVVRKGLLIGFATKLSSGSGGVLIRSKLCGSLTLPIITMGVIGTPQMVFINLINTTHVNMTIDWPPMNSMAAGGYRSANATNLRGGYQKPFLVTTSILDHKDGHYVRPNKVTLKYFDF
jgi:hypothetical protein